jgi:heme-degrading monooxygenase HmoA
MIYLLIQHQVKDYSKWKPLFDQNAPFRKTSGSQGGRVFRSTDDPNKITALFTWDNLENARKFSESDNLHKVMEQAGVIGKPSVYFLEEVDKTNE